MFGDGNAFFTVCRILISLDSSSILFSSLFLVNLTLLYLSSPHLHNMSLLSYMIFVQTMLNLSLESFHTLINNGSKSTALLHAIRQCHISSYQRTHYYTTYDSS
eukprot:982615_1